MEQMLHLKLARLILCLIVSTFSVSKAATVTLMVDKTTAYLSGPTNFFRTNVIFTGFANVVYNPNGSMSIEILGDGAGSGTAIGVGTNSISAGTNITMFNFTNGNQLNLSVVSNANTATILFSLAKDLRVDTLFVTNTATIDSTFTTDLQVDGTSQLNGPVNIDVTSLLTVDSVSVFNNNVVSTVSNYFSGPIRINTGSPGAGKVLESDADGNVSWGTDDTGGGGVGLGIGTNSVNAGTNITFLNFTNGDGLVVTVVSNTGNAAIKYSLSGNVANWHQITTNILETYINRNSGFGTNLSLFGTTINTILTNTGAATFGSLVTNKADVKPTPNATVNLGSTGLRWNQIWGTEFQGGLSLMNNGTVASSTPYYQGLQSWDGADTFYSAYYKAIDVTGANRDSSILYLEFDNTAGGLKNWLWATNLTDSKYFTVSTDGNSYQSGTGSMARVQLTTGAGANKALVSDANGIGSWTDLQVVSGWLTKGPTNNTVDSMILSQFNGGIYAKTNGGTNVTLSTTNMLVLSSTVATQPIDCSLYKSFTCTNVMTNLTLICSNVIPGLENDFLITGATNGGANYTVTFSPIGANLVVGYNSVTNGATHATVTNNQYYSAYMKWWPNTVQTNGEFYHAFLRAR